MVPPLHITHMTLPRLFTSFRSVSGSTALPGEIGPAHVIGACPPSMAGPWPMALMAGRADMAGRARGARLGGLVRSWLDGRPSTGPGRWKVKFRPLLATGLMWSYSRPKRLPQSPH